MRRKSINSLSRHVPQRTCFAFCRVGDKRQLIRLVKASGGGVEVDRSGRAKGRGAYLCTEPDCWRTGLGKSGRLERALRTSITQEECQRLLQFSKDLVERPTGGDGK